MVVGELDPLRPTSILTAMTVKALGLLLEERPDLNRIYARTMFGSRLICPDYVAVNVPILIDVGNKKVQSAMIIQNPQTKSVEKIRAEMRATVKAGLANKPIARFVSSRANTWWNRAALRVLHFAAYQFPKMYLKRRAGGVSLSSLIYEGKCSVPMTTVSFGPTAFTVALTSAWQDGGRWMLRIGVGFDHFVGSGELAVYFAKRLATILGGQDPVMFERLTGKPLPTIASSRPMKEKMVSL